MPTPEARLALLESAPLDSWIAFSQDESRIVAAARTLKEVIELSRAAGEFDPLITKTPPDWLPMYL